MVTQAIIMIGFAAKTGKALKDISEVVEEMRDRVSPLIDTATEIGETTNALLRDTVPRMRAITDNLLETSEVVRNSAVRFDGTIADVNRRAQLQVARIDTMVTAALATTVQIAEDHPARRGSSRAQDRRRGEPGQDALRRHPRQSHARPRQLIFGIR